MSDYLTSGFAQDFWSALEDGRLVVQHCRTCNHLQMYPRVRCITCGSTDLDFEPASGDGHLYTFTTVVKYAPSAFANDVPYTLAIIRLAEGPQMLSRVVTESPDDLSCGARVRFVPITVNDRLLPGFEPA